VEKRTYNGRNAGLLVVAATVVTFVLLNLLGRATRPRPREPQPSPTIVSVSPSIR
jgi:hypothetical protein